MSTERNFSSKEERRKRMERMRRRQAIFCGRILCALTALLAIFLLCNALNANGKKPKEETMQTVAVRIEARDTAWSIARRYCPNDMDIREYLQIVEKKNGTTFNRKIHPGEIIYFLEEVEK